MAKPSVTHLPPHSTDVSLAPGQSFHGYVSQGTVLHVEQGRVVLTPASRWLADSVWRTDVSLTAGHVFVTETGGWITLASDAGARVACREYAAATPSGVAPGRQWAGRLERLFWRFGLHFR
ncbi:hypothetical protein [Pandoraea sputorum]|uniref:DUF2917 domain-containing protein n=1 Tax=Pandoraea sputorum TaxID=93222 RepID=A0A239SRL3_9BURK|nr:hypothetical protein [Pandoraea sputorum]APD12588.1 hypothetical protein NA29_24550 [Pandoraea sputorum]SNU88125.1 Uncharacterised protein [Pandoraea sputorum]VVE53154.1 hypothetical protein PSP20601_04815 [Pandoraea sputorum]